VRAGEQRDKETQREGETQGERRRKQTNKVY